MQGNISLRQMPVLMLHRDSVKTIGGRIVQLNIVDILYVGYTSSLHDQSMRQLTQTHITKEDLTGI